MIASEDIRALDEFERLLTTLAGLGSTGKAEVTIFYLKHAKATVIAEVLDEVFGGGTGGSSGGGGGLIGDLAGAALREAGGGVVGSLLGLGSEGSLRATGSVQITPDSRLNALIVRANPVDLDMIEQLLKVLDQKGSPEEILAESKPRPIPVYNTQAQEIAEVVKQVYQDRMVAAAGAGGQQRQPTPEEFIQMLRGGRGGGGRRGSRSEQQTKMSVAVDYRTNSIIVAAPEALFQEVRDLVQMLDEAAIDSHETIEVVTLRRTSSEAVRQALSGMMGSSVQFGRSGGGRSGSSSSQGPQGMPGGAPFMPPWLRGGGFGQGFGGQGFGQGFQPSPGGGPPQQMFPGRFGGGGFGGGGFGGGQGQTPSGFGRGGGGFPGGGGSGRSGGGGQGSGRRGGGG
jgi:type II secretory pathway component GspD/PulD (secretin)